MFSNAPLVVSQLGTIEEWSFELELSFPWKYVGHPFHIHINDYQVVLTLSWMVNVAWRM